MRTSATASVHGGGARLVIWCGGLAVASALSACGAGAPPDNGAASSPAESVTPDADQPAHAATPAAQRPMDEVPKQKTNAAGEREYQFNNGCVVVIEPKRAVVKSEGPGCASHHRDIALLYAAGD
ncbi:hypothetical protein ABRP17_004730 [Stenotrophomonas sp. WHRI 8082]|uniref:hypothetical protein n=1 Tax=Stenotrophomonas sp. WHRI 8082 TaxID=3162571 RepID=UPI0032EDDBBF